MPRVARYTLNALTLLSLLLCVATVVVCVRSYGRKETASYQSTVRDRDQSSITVSAVHGRLIARWGHQTYSAADFDLIFSDDVERARRHVTFDTEEYEPNDVTLRNMGWFSYRDPGDPRPLDPSATWGRFRVLTIPVALLVTVSALAPVAWGVGSLRRRRRRAPGFPVASTVHDESDA